VRVWRCAVAVLALPALLAATARNDENAELFRALGEVHGLSPSQLDSVRAIFARSGVAGQGNPAVTVHPMGPEECRARVAAHGASYDNPAFAKICGGRYMAPLYDPANESPEDARACIDQFEFPDIPCAYPVVWIQAREAAEVCTALDKRLCDAHEWEGACEGRLLAPDYRFDLARGVDTATAVKRMREAHNREYGQHKSWAYGSEYRSGVCATSGEKTAGCDGGNWQGCGSNTFPAGSFPDCVSLLGVYDLHGNAAEHMNLPLDPSQMASRGSHTLGVTEMKGSWFIFDRFHAHQDWCRWRAPFWHGTRVINEHSHHNYHLGFRCCKDVVKP